MPFLVTLPALALASATDPTVLCSDAAQPRRLIVDKSDYPALVDQLTDDVAFQGLKSPGLKKALLDQPHETMEKLIPDSQFVDCGNAYVLYEPSSPEGQSMSDLALVGRLSQADNGADVRDKTKAFLDALNAEQRVLFTHDPATFLKLVHPTPHTIFSDPGADVIVASGERAAGVDSGDREFGIFLGSLSIEQRALLMRDPAAFLEAAGF